MLEFRSENGSLADAEGGEATSRWPRLRWLVYAASRNWILYATPAATKQVEVIPSREGRGSAGPAEGRRAGGELMGGPCCCAGDQ